VSEGDRGLAPARTRDGEGLAAGGVRLPSQILRAELFLRQLTAADGGLRLLHAMDLQPLGDARAGLLHMPSNALTRVADVRGSEGLLAQVPVAQGVAHLHLDAAVVVGLFANPAKAALIVV
jgi:hypothetical protein